MQRAVGDAEFFEVAHRIGEIVAAGAAAAGGDGDDLRRLVERQAPGVIRPVAAYDKGIGGEPALRRGTIREVERFRDAINGLLERASKVKLPSEAR